MRPFVRSLTVASALGLLLTACGGGGGGGGTPQGPTGGQPPVGNPTPPTVSKVDFRDEIIYFALTDRFANGDTSNDDGNMDRAGDAGDPSSPVGWHGGDFAGLRQKIEEGYFQRMGFTAIWISPVVVQVAPTGTGGGVNSNDLFVGFHGYWPEDFDVIEPHFGTLDSLVALREAADAAGIKLIIDVVVNHAGVGSSLVQAQPTWFRTGNECGSDDVTSCLFGLPDFRQENTAARDFLLDSIAFLRDNVGMAGIRMDTMKHVPDFFWREFFADGSPADPTEVWTVGEVFSSSVPQIAHYLDDLGSPSVLDFPLRAALLDSIARGGSTARLADLFAADATYSDASLLSTFLDNHDVQRFTTESEQAGKSPAEADERLDMGLTLIYLARGIPVVYYGTEIAMRGEGDSFNLPLGRSSREDMDFSALAGSAFDERLAALAQARRDYPVLKRGAQATLYSPGQSCQPAAGTGDPAAAYGEEIFVRGSFDGWAAPPSSRQRFENLGGERYEAAVELGGGSIEFKIASSDWSTEFANPSTPSVLDQPLALGPASGAGSNSRITLPAAACYAFELDTTVRDAPVLTVSERAAGGGDRDVMAFLRSDDGEVPVVVVVNNENAPVALDSLPGDGIDVSGVLPDGAVVEVTGTATNLSVSGGRLIGSVPALTVTGVASQ